MNIYKIYCSLDELKYQPFPITPFSLKNGTLLSENGVIVPLRGHLSLDPRRSRTSGVNQGYTFIKIIK